MEELYKIFIKTIDKNRVCLNEPMSKHTTFKVGGPADIFIKIENLEELIYVIKKCKEKNININVVGNGSNILVKDKGIRGVVIKLEFNQVEFLNDKTIRAGAGVLLSKLSRIACEHGLSGLEFACGIPGSVAGAIKMNAGAYGGEIKDIIVSTTYIDENLKLHTINNKENEFDYRYSRFFYNKKDIIIYADLELVEGDKEEIKKVMDSNMKSRKDKQPLNYASAGSTFKREKDYITAKLIDQCGLKGYNIGDAYVSEKHAGFVVNKGNAKASDILELIEIIKRKVYEKFNIQIKLEIEVLGED